MIVPTRCCSRATHCSCTRGEDSTVWRPGPGPRLRGTEVRQVALVHRPVVVEHEVEVGEGGGLHRGEVAVVAVRVLAQPPADIRDSNYRLGLRMLSGAGSW